MSDVEMNIWEQGPVLGLDCDGRPLKAGHRVMVVKTTHPEMDGAIMQIVGSAGNPEWADVELSPRRHDGLPWVAWGRDLRRIDDPDSASWDQVTKSTGWTPGVPSRTPEEVS